MTRLETCQAIQELFPLLANGALPAEDRQMLLRHLHHCATCRHQLQNEMPLYLLALQNSGPVCALTDHPEIDTLQSYSYNPQELDIGLRDQVRAHLADCALCREICEKLLSLEVDATLVLNAESAPFLSGLDHELSRRRPAVRLSSRVRRLLWSPAAGYLAAGVAVACLVVSTILLPDNSEQRYPVAVVDVTIPGTLRTVPNPLLFAAPTPQAYLNVSAVIRPDEGHSYDILLSRPGTGETIREIDSCQEFDPTGAAHFTVLADTGDFLLTVRDIEGSDTVSWEQPFTVRYVSP